MVMLTGCNRMLPQAAAGQRDERRGQECCQCYWHVAHVHRGSMLKRCLEVLASLSSPAIDLRARIAPLRFKYPGESTTGELVYHDVKECVVLK
jgi:hypothetical protein